MIFFQCKKKLQTIRMYITVGCYRSTAAHPYILGAFDNLKTQASCRNNKKYTPENISTKNARENDFLCFKNC